MYSVPHACRESRIGLRDFPNSVSSYSTLGVTWGQTVRVSTEKGSLTIPVETTWQTCRGYCLIPHHMGLLYEGKTYGTHINYLTDHRDIDALAGNARWRYTPCRVEAVSEEGTK